MEVALLVTSTSAVAILADRLIATVACLVFIGTIVTRMATRAIRLKRGILPGNKLGVLLMTVGTRQITAMVEWLKRRSSVTKLIRYKRVRIVAAVALLRGTEVARVLANSDNAVVTGRTRAQYLGVIDVKYG